MIFVFSVPQVQEGSPRHKNSPLRESQVLDSVPAVTWTSFPSNSKQAAQYLPRSLQSQLSSLPGGPRPSPQNWPSSLRFCLQTFIHHTFTSSHCGHLPSQILWVGWKLSQKRNVCLCSFQLAPRHTSQVHSFTVALIIAFLQSSVGGRTVEKRLLP